MQLEHILAFAIALLVATLSAPSECMSVLDSDAEIDSNRIDETAAVSDMATEFWEQIYQNSMLNTKSRYSVLNDERVCFTCPIDRITFTSLYHEALDQQTQQHQQQQQQQKTSSAFGAGSLSQPLAPLTITWAAQLNENRVLFFCRNNSRLTSSPVHLSSEVSGGSGANDGNERSERHSSTQLDYSCENNRLCLSAVKSSYPKIYQCFIKSYVLNVKLDVIVQLQYVLLYFTGDSVKFDYQKEVTVQEGQPFTVKCEVPETNPVSIVSAFIDNQELTLTALDKKTLDNRMTINTYSFLVNATRDMNQKKIKCEAVMRDLPVDLANTIDLRSHLSKDYILSVHYLPTCTYPTRTYRAGINRSLVIECPVNSSNPEVTYYKIIPPSTRTKFELIDSSLDTLSRMGRFRIQPTSQADFGLYECIPRSLAGTAKCDINVELGATPNPPEQCTVQFALVNNKTFAQFSCKPGYNQGGSSSFLTIYELIDKQLKLSGRVNIDESKVDKEVPYITPADEDKYYEYLVMQENNYGNSSSVLLTLGSLPEAKASPLFELKNVYWIAGGAAVLLLIICVCSCCCCSDTFSTTSSSKNDSGFCARCCGPSDNLDDDGVTYKKAPLDAGSPVTGNGYSGGYIPVDNIHTNSLLKMSYNAGAGNYNSNYEYYDNTTAGGLYGTPSKQKSRNNLQVPLNKGKKTAAVNSYDVYNYELQRDDDEEDKEVEEENYEDEEHLEDDDEIESISSGSEKNTNSTSGNEESSGSGGGDGGGGGGSGTNHAHVPTYAKPSPTVATTAAMFNNNVSGSIGSGVESIKKHTYGLNNGTQQRSTGKSINHNSHTGTYSTIDSKKKLIKTENGLVYTPIINTSKTTTTDEENGIGSGGEPVESPCMDYDNFEMTTTAAATRRPTTLLNNKPQPSHQQQQFQSELSQKLKSINSSNNATPVAANATTTTTARGAAASNSTATTSISSASSCASSTNSDMLGVSSSTSHRIMSKTATTPQHQLHQAQVNINRTMANELNINGSKNYSLLKTTINMSQTSSAIAQQANASAANANGSNTLGRTNKPPILKPKPRSNGNGIYQQISNGRIYESPSSMHNQSGEALLSVSSHRYNPNHRLHATAHETPTSPSTSITDISSTNCTPQHDNSVGPLIFDPKQHASNRSTNTLGRTAPPPKVTTTFGALASSHNTNGSINGVNGGLYSTVTTTKSHQHQSPLRKIDENNYEIVRQPGTTGIAPIAATLYSNRTMERRHVKNSEI